jgi:hypothetical protein
VQTCRSLAMDIHVTIHFYVNTTILLRQSMDSFDIFTSLAKKFTDENP